MADRTTGELQSVNVSDLPPAADIYDDFKMPGELQGDAVHVTGAQMKRYAVNAVAPLADAASVSAEKADADAAAAYNAKTAAQSALTGIQNAIKNIPAGSTPIVNNLTTGGKNAALSAEMGKTLGQRPNPQLLDNGYFLIDQRGQTTYTTSGIQIDRWWLDGNITATIQYTETYGGLRPSTGVKLTNRSSKDAVMQQYLDEILSIQKNAGMTVTISIMADGKVWSASGPIPDSAPPEARSYAAVGTDFFYLRLNISTDGRIRFAVVLKPNATTVIQAAKLELGSVQTLAHQDDSGKWVLNEVPSYAEELARCQRYQLRVRRPNSNYLISLGAGISNAAGSLIRVSIPTPTTMIKNPQVVYLNGSTVADFTLKKDGTTITPSAVTTLQYEGAVVLVFTVSGAAATSVYAVDFHPNGFLLDAN